MFGVRQGQQGVSDVLSRSLELWSNFDRLPELLEPVPEICSFAQDAAQIVVRLSEPRIDLDGRSEFFLRLGQCAIAI